MIMKKTYINPETSIVLLTMQHMIATSNPEGFNSNLDDSTPINDPSVILSRRKTVWDSDETEEEELY